MLYRRKILLTLLQSFGGSLTSIDLQKLVFLFTQGQEKPCYDFVPHKFGCYSFQLQADCQGLALKGYLEKISDSWRLISDVGTLPPLIPEDQQYLQRQVDAFMHIRGDDLVRHVYREFPYFATNSLIAHRLLTESELQVIDRTRCNPTGHTLYTTGYEGLSVDAFLDRLLQHGVRHLCDVRRNPLSMKPGFSKGRLSAVLGEVGISYSHHPKLGIDSTSRKATAQTKDWESLFSSYENRIAEQTDELLPDFLELLQQHERVALMCFEANACDCHRGRLVKVLKSELLSAYPVVHL